MCSHGRWTSMPFLIIEFFCFSQSFYQWLGTPRSVSLVVTLHLHWAFVHLSGQGLWPEEAGLTWPLPTLNAGTVVANRRSCHYVWPKVEKTSDVYVMLRTLSGWWSKSFPSTIDFTKLIPLQWGLLEIWITFSNISFQKASVSLSLIRLREGSAENSLLLAVRHETIE